MKKICCALIALLPLTAFAYPIEIDKKLNGAEVSVTGLEIDDSMGAVVLYNYGQADAKCKATFRNGPEAPRTRSAALSGGEDTNLSIKFSRKIIKLRVSVVCEVERNG
ncbi:3-phosphoglycerate kinase [Pseudomonas marincola]|uniref:3-phosphoglycerate kinase n=1 Tax=Pseudomonas marincola TaxID=437900 RepID=A0A653E5L5_9PSED|nr:3-phosphoglycerate kinase [Pseudomonas marincola]CAE6903351.1 3-phosphoglycerate kinase [Pseudomonas marincola]